MEKWGSSSSENKHNRSKVPPMPKWVQKVGIGIPLSIATAIGINNTPAFAENNLNQQTPPPEQQRILGGNSQLEAKRPPRAEQKEGLDKYRFGMNDSNEALNSESKEFQTFIKNGGKVIYLRTHTPPLGERREVTFERYESNSKDEGTMNVNPKFLKQGDTDLYPDGDTVVHIMTQEILKNASKDNPIEIYIPDNFSRSHDLIVTYTTKSGQNVVLNYSPPSILEVYSGVEQPLIESLNKAGFRVNSDGRRSTGFRLYEFINNQKKTETNRQRSGNAEMYNRNPLNNRTKPNEVKPWPSGMEMRNE